MGAQDIIQDIGEIFGSYGGEDVDWLTFRALWEVISNALQFITGFIIVFTVISFSFQVIIQLMYLNIPIFQASLRDKLEMIQSEFIKRQLQRPFNLPNKCLEEAESSPTYIQPNTLYLKAKIKHLLIFGVVLGIAFNSNQFVSIVSDVISGFIMYLRGLIGGLL